VIKTAIVILNYNGRHHLEQFLPTVVLHSPVGSVFVADNASQDDSVAWLQANFPQVMCIELPQNDGYAGGYNNALAQIEANYYVLLNSDVEVTPGWLLPLINLLDNSPDVAACQPKIRSYHRRDEFEYAGAAGGYLDWLGFAFCRGRIFDSCERDTGQYDDTVDIFWATGACMVIRAKTFHELGGFDSDFFAHFEEIDLCWRVHLAGHRIQAYGGAVVYHVGGGTLAVENPFKTYLNYRNSLSTLYKNLPASGVATVVFLRLIIDGLSSVRYLIKWDWANIWAVIRAHFAFYRAIPSLRLKRRAVWQMARKNGSKKSVTLYTHSIIWQYFAKKKNTFSSLSAN
jgi:GT2 family glycosyltransferase